MLHRRPALVALIVLPLSGLQAVAQQVGTAAAVNPAAQARGPGGARTIIIGNSIAHRERVQTTSAGSVQLVFLDKTSMTVGPNSDLAIDEYVYDPATNTGKLAATLTKGVMRFVGGQISHAGNAQITTPSAVVGIRGGVGIFHSNSVYIGFGQGQVTSGSSSVTLEAGEFTQTMGGVPPTSPGPPPPGFLQAVLAMLQSQPGQGGGARATTSQINRARTAATGSAAGNIATSILPINVSVDIPFWALSWITPTIQTSINNSPLGGTTNDGGGTDNGGIPGGVPLPQPTPPIPGGGPSQQQTLVGYTGGTVQTIGRDGSPIGQSFGALGAMALQLNPAQNRSQANLFIGATSQESQNSLQFGSFQFGSVDPTLPSGNVTINEIDQLIGTASALAPAVSAQGTPTSIVNNERLTTQEGVFVEIQRGSQLSTALSSRVGQSFCQCEYTRWGLWNSQFTRPGPNNSTIEERAQMFWVAGRLPTAGEVPTAGSATYDGHAIAAIRNGSQNYVSAGAFQNTVNFGTRTGVVSVTGLDSTNYGGQVTFGSDPRFFAGALSGLNNQSRAMVITGSFFNGARGPAGEMGGALQVGGSSYSGSGIFAATQR